MNRPTKAQMRALEFLRERADADAERPPGVRQGMTGRELAWCMWPDSPAWDRVTKRGGAGGPGGAMGGTMPMNGARLGWRLCDAGLARKEFSSVHQVYFIITGAGRRALQDAELEHDSREPDHG